MKLNINVTQNDIDRGENCPVALALLNKGYKNPYIDNDENKLSFNRKNKFLYFKMPRFLINWTEKFDNYGDKPPKPFNKTFNLKQINN